MKGKAFFSAYPMVLRMILVWLLGVSLVQAEGLNPETTLRFEVSPFKDRPLFCEREDALVPDKHSFQLVDYVLMSSDRGERFALVTLKNQSTGQRILSQNHLVAVMGNCQARRPLPIEKRFAGAETLTIRLNFGLSKFPILKIQAD